SVIDLTTETVTGTAQDTSNLLATPCCGGFGIAVNSAGTRAYFAAGGSLGVIDTATDEITNAVNSGSGPLVISPDESIAYMEYTEGDTSLTDIPRLLECPAGVSAFVCGAELAQFGMPNSHSNRELFGPANLALSPDGATLYAVNGASEVYATDTASLLSWARH